MAYKNSYFLNNKTIFLPICKEDYQKFMGDNKFAKSIINASITTYPELFPKNIVNNKYVLYGVTAISKKQNIAMRRIKIGEDVFQICSSDYLPYMSGRTDEVEKALFLMKFHIPFWALSYVFGKDPKYWYRIYCHFGAYNIVGTTIKKAENIPVDLLADEEHVRVKGQKAFIATTIGNGCILGAQATESASEEALIKAYSIFKEETLFVNPQYSAKTINTDGWAATQRAWKVLYSTVVIIQCFLHAFIKIRDRALQKFNDVFRQISQKVWDAYKANNKRTFSQRIRRIKKWAQDNVPESIMKTKLIDLCLKRKLWATYYDYPHANRTSNGLDRIMKFMARHLYMHQNYHSNISKTTLNIRAFALIYNFSPYNPRTIKRLNGISCPAENVNNFKYHNNWLHNLLISCSLQAKFCINQQNLT